MEHVASKCSCLDIDEGINLSTSCVAWSSGAVHVLMDQSVEHINMNVLGLRVLTVMSAVSRYLPPFLTETARAKLRYFRPACTVASGVLAGPAPPPPPGAALGARPTASARGCMHSMSKLVTLLLLTALAQQVVGWTQQYGDSRSSSYLLFSGPTPSGGWNYTTEPFVSETSPSVSADGTIFYPLRANVVAVAVNGSQVWKADVAPNGEAYLTNTVFWDGLVLVGSSWVQQTTFFQVVALRADDGVVMWKSVQNDLFHATTISISDTASAVYLAGYDQSTLSALRLSDGSVLWKKKNIYQVGIFMQTKVGPVKAKSGQKLSNSEIVILPTDPYDGFEGNGTLIAYDVAGSGAEVWRRNAGFSAGGLFAFSHQGLVYGSIGGGGGAQGQQIFGIDASGGELVFSNAGYCDSGSQFSGPAVDLEGYAYYR